VVPGGLQRVVLEHFRRQPAKSSQEASRGSFWSISNTSPQSGPRRPPEGRFGGFQAPARKVIPGGLQRVVAEGCLGQLLVLLLNRNDMVRVLSWRQSRSC
jgi:hypothetical protein